jgi:hypothetical protein
MVQVELAKMKLKNTLEEVEKALVYQSDDMLQRAGDLHNGCEEMFAIVTRRQKCWRSQSIF